MDLLAAEERLREVHRRAWHKSGQWNLDAALLSAGEHCDKKYCPASDGCPALTALAEVVIPAAALVRSRDAEAIDAYHAAKKLLEDFKAKLEQRADELGGILLPDGRTWRKTETPCKASNCKACGVETRKAYLRTEYKSVKQ